MSYRDCIRCVIVAFCLLRYGTTVSAQSLPNYLVDAQIPITSSDGFNTPQGLAVAPGRTIYVADKGNQRVLKFAADGSRTVVSFGTLAPAVSTPGGVALDGGGNLYVTDVTTNRLIKLAPGAMKGLSVISGSILDQPIAVASDVAGNLAIANAGNGTVIVRRYGGTPVPFNTGSTVLIAPTAVAFDNQGMLYVADAGDSITPAAIYRFPKLGGTGTSVAPAGYPLKHVTGLVLDDQRNLYVLDGASQQLIEVPVSGATAFLIPQSNFKSPSGLALDNLGNIYVSDSGASSNTVTKLVYNNATNFGSVQVGATSNPITFNFEFYTRTGIEATRGIGGGVWNAEYKKAPGGTCTLRTYYPTVSSSGLTLPASCTAVLTFTPMYPGGRPGAAQLQTSNGNISQLTIGTGMGGQLALLNAPVTTKLGTTEISGPMVVNDAGTTIYFGAPGGTYRMAAGGGTPTLVTPQTGLSLAINGAGDLFLFSPPTITKIPADGSPNVVIHVPGLFNPQAMAMDSNGAFYISDLGPPQTYPDYNLAGFVLRVSPTGVVSKILPPGYWVTPTFIAKDGQGNIFVADGAQRLVFEVAAWTGIYTQSVATGLVIGGSYGTGPMNLAVDTSGTLYYWDSFANQNIEGMAYSSPSGQNGPYLTNSNAGESQLPVYTIPPIVDYNGGGSLVPFYSAFGNQTLITSPSGKLYVANGQGPGFFVVDRTQGNIPWQAFNPNTLWIGASTQAFFVYNVGNQNVTFTDTTKTFTESGSGMGSFSFTVPPPPPPYTNDAVPCQPGTVLIPGNYCAIYATNTNGLSRGPIVTDTLHFLTDAVNNNSVSFRINGVANQAP